MDEVSLALPDRTAREYGLGAGTSKLGSDLWEKAVQRLDSQDKLQINLQADRHTVLAELFNLVTERQQACVGKQWKYTKRNGDVVFVRDTLARLSAGIKRFQEIGDVVMQYDPAHAALPWAGVRVLLKIAINDNETYAAMMDGVEHVSRLIVRYALIESMYLKPGAIIQDQLQQCIIELYVAILTYLSKASAYYTRGTAARISRGIVQSSTGVEKQLENIHERSRRVDEVVGLIEADFTRRRARFMMEEFGTMKDSFTGIEHGLLGLNKQLSGFAEKLDPFLNQSPKVSRERLLTWLDAVFTDDEWETSLRARTPGTCEWILERPIFQEWIQGEEKQVLWIYGNPGFGKSVLSAYIIDYLRHAYPDRVAFFFCTSDNEEKRQPLAIVRSWVAQTMAHVNALEAIQDEYHQKEHRTATTADVWQMFRHICKTVNCFFVIDGLDECTDGREITKFLSELTVSACRVLVVSRPRSEIRAQFRHLTETSDRFQEYEISLDDTKNDIAKFSSSMVAARLPKKSDLLKTEMTLEASQRSQGMFLWVRLLGDRLDPTENTKELRKIINEMPREIEETYATELRRIGNLPRHRSRAIAILRWTLYARRPLTVREITEALAIQDDDGDNYPIENLPDSWAEEEVNDRIRRLCGSLITLEKRDDQQPSQDQTVHFIHFSVREYLSMGALPELQFNGPQEHDLLAQVCLRYMCYPEISGEDFDRDSVAQKIEKYAFLEYAANSWYLHARAAKWSSQLTHSTNVLFEPASRRWIPWVHIAGDELARASSVCNVIGFNEIPWAPTAGNELTRVSSISNVGGFRDADRNIPALYCAALLGFLPPMQYILAQGADVNDASDLGTPLHGAAAGGHIEAVQLLLDHGANVDAQEPVNGMTPLCYAAVDGRAAIVELLSAYDANAGLCNNDGIAPLMSAAYLSRFDVVQILLEQKVDINCRDLGGLSALHYAAYSGNANIVRSLIEHDAEINAFNQDGMTPIYCAVLGIGFSLANKSTSYDETRIGVKVGSSMGTAATDNRADLVRLLISAGANVNATRCDGQTPLSLAVRKSQETIVQLLVDSGADVNSSDEDKTTPLHYASRKGNVDIVRFLIQRGADLNARDPDQLAAIHIAATRYRDTTECLLRAGADVASNSCHGYKPLHFAACCGSLETAKTLLNHGADPNVTSANGRTPLHHACHYGKYEMAKWLLENGADVNAEDDSEGSPLEEAVLAGHMRITELLLTHNRAGRPNTSALNRALQGALSRNRRQLVEMLVDEGAELGAQTQMQETPAHRAAYAGRASLVASLLDRGADGTIIDSYGWTVYDWIAENPKTFAGLPNHPRASDRARKQALADSIVRLTKLLLELSTHSSWDTLGRCLLLAGNPDAAHDCFLRTNKRRGAHVPFQVYCDLCLGIKRKNIRITGRSRFVCRTCPNVDLCQACFAKYPMPEKLPGCRDHEFLEVCRKDGEAPGDGMISQEIVDFLHSLLRQYGSDAERQETTEHEVGSQDTG